MSGIPLSSIPEERIFALAERLDVRGPRYTSYPTVPVWQDNFSHESFEAALSQLSARERPIAIYVHLPFCRRRCLYCGCNSYITNDAERMQSYADALLREIELVSEHLANVQHAQLHLGGGTPTHYPPELLDRILERVLRVFPGGNDAERSIEVDPRITTAAHLRILQGRGFRRISVGLQDLNADVQRAVQREFSLEQTQDFLTLARQHGFTSVNLDLIYGLPLQTRTTWRKTLAAIAELKPDRIATFGYAHLPERIRHQQAIREEDLPSSRERLGMMLDAQKLFAEAGYISIGMDHFALPGDELAIARAENRVWRNFMGYTTARGMELLGLGCSAISEFDDLFAQNIVSPEPYAQRLAEGTWAVQRGHRLDHDDRVRKHIINHLMCNLDVRIPPELVNGHDALADALSRAMQSLRAYADEGLLIERSDGYTVTPLGQIFVRNLAMPFDRYLETQQGVRFSRTV